MLKCCQRRDGLCYKVVCVVLGALQSLTEDVARQTDRERELQTRYALLLQHKEDLLEQLNE